MIILNGIAHESDVTLEYCWQLVQEYSILEKTQIYNLLKRVGKLKKNQRHGIVRGLCKQWHIHEIVYEGRNYLANRPKLLPTGQYKKQIVCFWILLDYLTQIESHYATGTFSRISLVINKKDYDIIYVEKGSESLSVGNIQKAGETSFIVVVEDSSQIPLIRSDKIRMYATVSKSEVTYYTMKGGADNGNDS